ncbi:MAG: hypothetical protein ABJO27_25145 [Pseudoruegeria sp.]
MQDEALINHLYEIAVDPGNFDGFVERWVEATNALDEQSLDRHLVRAMTFLERLEPTESDHATLLKRYDRFAALIVAQNGVVERANNGAHKVFGLKAGDRLGATDRTSMN